MKIACDIISITFAIAAAVYWIRSAYVHGPKGSGVITLVKELAERTIPAGKNIMVGNSLIDKEKFYENMSALVTSYNRQSKLSGKAAICAAIAASFQALSYCLDLFKHC